MINVDPGFNYREEKEIVVAGTLEGHRKEFPRTFGVRWRYYNHNNKKFTQQKKNTKQT